MHDRLGELSGPSGRVELTCYQALDVRPEDVTELEPGVQVRAHALGHDDHLEQQGELVRDGEVVAPQDRQDVADERPDRDLAERSSLVAAEQGGRVGGQPGALHGMARDADLDQRGRDPVQIVATEAGEQRGEALLRRLVDLPDHAEVDEADPAARFVEQVARVRVAVEEPVLEDHAGGDRGGAHGERGPFDACGIERVEIADLDALQPLQGKHS